MGKFSCCDKEWHKRGQWTPDEDQKLRVYIDQHGHGSWRDLPEKAGLQRCGKSCRLRWINYLRPDIKRGKFSLQEEQTIIRIHALLGNRWSVIANQLPRRTDNEIKNYWNTHLKKKLMKMGIDPVTHNPKSCQAATLSHMAQWETTRLEAESKLVCKSKVVSEPSRQHFGSVPKLLTHAATIRPAKPHTQCLDILKAWQTVVSGMLFKASNFSENANLLSTPTIGIGTANPEHAVSTSITCNTAGGSEWNCFDKSNEVMNNHSMTLHEMTYTSGDNEQLPDFFRPEEHEYYAPATTSMMEDSLDASVRDFDYWNTSMATEKFYESYGYHFELS